MEKSKKPTVLRFSATNVARAVSVLVCSCVVGFLSACAADPRQGYSTASSFPADISTVNVPMFKNSTFIHGLEIELTTAVQTELRRQSPYRVTSSEVAQTTLSGTIVRSEMRKLSVGRDTGIAEDLALVLTIDFTWKDNRSGKVIVERRNFVGADSFTPARAVGESLELGQQGAVARLARDMVNEMRSAW
ncbi:MAG: hypothetical protein IBJ18_04325 [Phycisphaerales bacterium]|nr:hypothetical protein [Phycisphaerales bacterium]